MNGANVQDLALLLPELILIGTALALILAARRIQKTSLVAGGTVLAALAAANPLTNSIHDFLIHPAMPVDVRHGAKIFREQLAEWATRKLR